ncbi:MAG: hypothetical protein KME31_26280 [Tolypothrix carrinoi HA7290-LM1]|nr:hypothetical protein [Tolypothrix carrinoi HA7290-LM1]
MGIGHWALRIENRINSSLSFCLLAPCPMTADAPLGETPRPHCLPHARCPMPNAHFGRKQSTTNH